MQQLLHDEDEIFAEMVGGRNSVEYQEMDDKHSQKFDFQVRRWLQIHLPELYDPTQKTSNVMAQKLRDKVLMPPVAGSDPTNCFYLRFPDLSPLFPTRSIESKPMFYELVKVSKYRCSPEFLP
jgi:hypothetical protein